MLKVAKKLPNRVLDLAIEEGFRFRLIISEVEAKDGSQCVVDLYGVLNFCLIACFTQVFVEVETGWGAVACGRMLCYEVIYQRQQLRR